MKSLQLFLTFGLSIILLLNHVSRAQTPFPCDGTMYLSNDTTLYTYSTSGAQTRVFGIGNVNALAFANDGILWAYDQSSPKSVVIVGADSTKTPISISGLPTTGIDYNVGAIDSNGYYFIYDGSGAARFYIIDTDTGRTTYGQLVDPTATSGVTPYSLDTRSPKGTPISPGIPAANRRIFSDWCFSPIDGMLYTVTNDASVNPHRLIKYNPVTGAMTEVTSGLTGGNSSCGGFQKNISLGALFIDRYGHYFVFGNTCGYLYSINVSSNTVTKLSTSSISSSNIDGANCVKSFANLPIKLLDFRTSKLGNIAQLVWTTAFEKATEGYVIETSLDGMSWNRKGFVHSKGANGNRYEVSDYTFTDFYPSNGRNFYRLKQIDLDGKFEYSPIEILSFENDPRIDIYPNPTQDKILIGGLDMNDVVNVYDVSGKLRLTTKAKRNVVEVSLSGVNDGVYHVRIIKNDGSVYSHNILKLH
ncbi:MAG: T9SS type A sorting domain-containing protein [Bacteroidetes bacterium]|nr:T9SS type A sorting domain-containing protein [Bacteroidota bacterium]